MPEIVLRDRYSFQDIVLVVVKQLLILEPHCWLAQRYVCIVNCKDVTFHCNLTNGAALAYQSEFKGF